MFLSGCCSTARVAVKVSREYLIVEDMNEENCPLQCNAAAMLPE